MSSLGGKNPSREDLDRERFLVISCFLVLVLCGVLTYFLLYTEKKQVILVESLSEIKNNTPDTAVQSEAVKLRKEMEELARQKKVELKKRKQIAANFSQNIEMLRKVEFDLAKVNREKKRLQLIKNFSKVANIGLIAPAGYNVEVVTSPYKEVEIIKAFHPKKVVEITTLASKVALEREDLDLASSALLGADIDDLEPLDNHGLKNNSFDTVSVYYVDDVNPTYGVVAKIKGKENSFYLVGVKGKKADVASELQKLRNEFSAIKINNLPQN